MILYLISGRSFTSNPLTRKNSEVASCFKRIMETKVICGADIYQRNLLDNTKSTSSASYYSKWYRRNILMKGLSQSYAEIKNVLHSYRLFRKISSDYETDKYTLICERSANLNWAGVLFAKRKGIPCILEWKDHLIQDYWSLFKPIAKYVENWKNRNADYILVESEVLKRQLVSEGVNENKIYVAYNAVNPEEFGKDEEACIDVRKELSVKEGEILVGYVGSYAYYHDSIRMLKAAKILKDRGVNNIKWLLIGDGKDKATCEQYAKENGLLDGTITMLPFQTKERIPRFLSAMDVTILPGSTDIICPIKVMEYMAAKSVVLVPDYECNREIIDGTNGLLFAPGDEESIAEKLLIISKDKSLCLQFGEAARKTVLEKLTWDKTYGSAIKCILIDIENNAHRC